MAYISFYRKWRPQGFDQVIGQDYNIRTIRNALSKKRLSHSYLLCCPRGTGKTSTARIFAKALNCEKGITADPCGKCENCISISNGNSVDVIEIDAASNRGIGEIRELREKVKYLPSILRKKVYIIDEVHMLTIEAFNALLKILEEPPEHICFIMATTEPNKVIPTIISRCQRFDFSPISLGKIKQRLQKIAKKENIKISDEALSLVSKHADGSLRDADGILEQLAAFGEDTIEAGDVVSLLGVIDLELLFELADILADKNISSGLLFVNKIISSNQSLKVLTQEFLDHLYNLYVIKNYKKPSEITDISPDYKKKYEAQSQKLIKEELEFYIDIFADLYKQIKWGEGSRRFFKAAIIRAVNFIAAGDKGLNEKTRALEAQLKTLNKRIEADRPGGSIAENKGVSTEKSNKAKAGENRPANPEKNGNPGSRKDPGSEDKDREDPARKGQDEEGSGTGAVKKADGSGGTITGIDGNLDEILMVMKKKKISVHAMFIESEPSRIEDGILYFILSEDKKWHKDHLSKAKNIELIAGIIEEVTGIKYKVKFELGKIKRKEGKNRKSRNEVIIEENNFSGDPERGFIGEEPPVNGEESKKQKKEESGDKGNTGSKKEAEGVKDGTLDDQEDVIKYFENKFKMKE